MTGKILGKSGIEVKGLAFGGNVFGWTVAEPEAFRLLDQFLAAGNNLVDTADVYSRWAPGNRGGESETLLGNWMKKRGNRKQVLIATKVGKEMGPGQKGLSQKYIRSAIEASLRRLQTDYIDLYQSHEDDADTPLEETMGAFATLIREGKVRSIGASNFTAARLQLTLETSSKLGLPRYESLQPLYNLYDREPFENELVHLCVREKIGVLSYYSLAMGFLTGKYRSPLDLSKSARGIRSKKYMDARGFRILQSLDVVSQRLNSTPACVSIAWLMSRPPVTAPIASATNPQQLKEIMDASDLKLSEFDLQMLEESSKWS
jgi:aryl-alcohol dehydrogenase-like predicted oxidoreductase